MSSGSESWNEKSENVKGYLLELWRTKTGKRQELV